MASRRDLASAKASAVKSHRSFSELGIVPMKWPPFLRYRDTFSIIIRALLDDSKA